MNEPEIVFDLVGSKLEDIETQGFKAEFTPEEADIAGAFSEDALSLEDAEEAMLDERQQTFDFENGRQ